MDPLAGYRAEFTESPRFLDFASVGPLSRRARRRLGEHADLLSMPDRSAVPELLQCWDEAKTLGGRLLGVEADHVTFVSSTSHGLFAAAFGIPEGNVVVPANEFPANLYPWIRAAEAGRVEVRQVPVPDGRVTVDALRPAVDAATVAVAVSAVGFWTGYRADLGALRELAGDALLIIDAVQALGALRVELDPADLVVAGSQKWMRAGIGSAILGVSDRLLERCRPLLTGWTGVEDMFGPAPAPHPALPTVDRFAMGSGPLTAVGAWRGALEVTLEAGIDRIEAAVLERAGAFAAALDLPGVELLPPARTGGERSSIFTFRVPSRDPAAVAQALGEEGFVLTYRQGADSLRVSAHATTPLTTAAELSSVLAKILH